MPGNSTAQEQGPEDVLVGKIVSLGEMSETMYRIPDEIFVQWMGALSWFTTI